MKLIKLMTIGCLAGLIGFGCGEEQLPSRDEIPILRQQLYALESGLAGRDRAAVDSLLAVEILDIDQGSDSLLQFVYGPDDDYPFHRLGDYDIFYNPELAVINCFIMDSSESHDRPLRLFYKHEDSLWLLRRFEVGPPRDSTGESTAGDEVDEW